MAEKKTPSKGSNGTAPKARTRKTSVTATAEPLTDTMSEEEIARKAYALWESRGRPIGSPDEDWYKAKGLPGHGKGNP